MFNVIDIVKYNKMCVDNFTLGICCIYILCSTVTYEIRTMVEKINNKK